MTIRIVLIYYCVLYLHFVQYGSFPGVDYALRSDILILLFLLIAIL